jgi:hypothetical protein
MAFCCRAQGAVRRNAILNHRRPRRPEIQRLYIMYCSDITMSEVAFLATRKLA